jgi:galactose oxidase-like protein
LGPNTSNGVGNYGTILVEAPTNVPRSRNECNASWTDLNNNLWLFGGHVYNPNNVNCHMGDMWKYDASANEWTWMKGQNVFDQPATYGTIMVPDPANNPTARAVYCKWKDNADNLWFFGGANSLGSTFNEMWRFTISTNNWTWMNGPNTINNISAIDSGQCTTNTVNMPGSRFENRASWTRDCQNFEIFGGFNDIANSNTLNDLWNYNVTCNAWGHC